VLQLPEPRSVIVYRLAPSATSAGDSPSTSASAKSGSSLSRISSMTSKGACIGLLPLVCGHPTSQPAPRPRRCAATCQAVQAREAGAAPAAPAGLEPERGQAGKEAQNQGCGQGGREQRERHRDLPCRSWVSDLPAERHRLPTNHRSSMGLSSRKLQKV